MVNVLVGGWICAPSTPAVRRAVLVLFLRLGMLYRVMQHSKNILRHLGDSSLTHNAIWTFVRVLDDGVAVVVCQLLDATLAQTFRPARYLLAALDEFPEPGTHPLADVVDTVDLLDHKVIVQLGFSSFTAENPLLSPSLT